MSYRKCYSFNVQDIRTRNGTTTLTIADGSLTNIIPRCDCPRIKLCVNTSFEVTSLCNVIEVTDGTDTLTIFCGGQYWRPERIKCNSNICTVYKPDPASLIYRGGKY